jgi:membrane protein
MQEKSFPHVTGRLPVPGATGRTRPNRPEGTLSMKLLRHKTDDDTSRSVDRQTAESDDEAGAARAQGASDFDLEAAATTRTGDDRDFKPATTAPGDGPDRPSQLGFKGIWAAVRRTASQYSIDNLSDWAAALTYYGVYIWPRCALLSAMASACHCSSAHH